MLCCTFQFCKSKLLSPINALRLIQGRTGDLECGHTQDLIPTPQTAVHHFHNTLTWCQFAAQTWHSNATPTPVVEVSIWREPAQSFPPSRASLFQHTTRVQLVRAERMLEEEMGQYIHTEGHLHRQRHSPTGLVLTHKYLPLDLRQTLTSQHRQFMASANLSKFPLLEQLSGICHSLTRIHHPDPYPALPLRPLFPLSLRRPSPTRSTAQSKSAKPRGSSLPCCTPHGMANASHHMFNPLLLPSAMRPSGVCHCCQLCVACFGAAFGPAH